MTMEFVTLVARSPLMTTTNMYELERKS